MRTTRTLRSVACSLWWVQIGDHVWPQGLDGDHGSLWNTLTDQGGDLPQGHHPHLGHPPQKTPVPIPWIAFHDFMSTIPATKLQTVACENMSPKAKICNVRVAPPSLASVPVPKGQALDPPITLHVHFWSVQNNHSDFFPIRIITGLDPSRLLSGSDTLKGNDLSSWTFS